ncbi:MAG TPA: cation transporter [Dehalococcoidia bacterium]|nr:cation transporter [Dehalococcoidia bacterium]
MNTQAVMQQEKRRAAALSVTSNGILVILKMSIGLIIGSISVLSEAIHSAMDLIAAVIALIAIRISGKEADKDHPFGHAKVESISAAIEALLIFAAAIWIIIAATHKLLSPQPLETVGWGVAVMCFSSIANLLISRMLFSVGTKTESPALIADAWHLRTDVYTSGGVMAGLGLIWIAGFIFPNANLNWIDPIAAILVALLILKTAYQLTAHAVKDLIDTSTPPEEKIWIEDYMKKLYPTVRSFHRLRTRKAGSNRFIDFHMVVDEDMTVHESHDIAEQITKDFRMHFTNADITLHIEPCDGVCKYSCISGCLLSENERKRVRQSKTKPTA